jgi:CBS domain-containing protein
MTGPGRVKRVPGIDDHQLVGMISESDLAQHLDDKHLGKFVEHVFARR